MYQVIFENDYYKQYYFLRTPFAHELECLAFDVPAERCNVTVYDENDYKDRIRRINHISDLENHGYTNDVRVFTNFFKKSKSLAIK